MTTTEQLQEEVKNCVKCGLHAGCKGKVFGEVDTKAPIMVIGEAPGFNEDVTGRPFTGPAGKLLDQMLDSIGLSRFSNVFVTNILKCRPPDNRNPEPDELKACGGFLERQIELIKPRFMIPTGAFSTSFLLGKDPEGPPIKITYVAGKQYKYKDIPFVPLLHPAYLLRNPAKKADTWEHLKLIFECLDKLDIYK